MKYHVEEMKRRLERADILACVLDARKHLSALPGGFTQTRLGSLCLLTPGAIPSSVMSGQAETTGLTYTHFPEFKFEESCSHSNNLV